MKDEFKTNKFAVAKEAAAVVDVEQFIVLQHVIFVDKQLTAKLVVVWSWFVRRV